jgi:hypothetical protein
MSYCIRIATCRSIMPRILSVSRTRLHECSERLEPDIRELISPVLRGGADGNAAPLPDTMRLTVLGQYVKGIKEKNAILAGKAEKALERIKHYLWHGNVFQALETVDHLEGEVENIDPPTDALRKLLKGIYELHTYIDNNRGYIPNFGERYRNGDSISTAFVESTVNQVISKRFVKKQSMQWTQRGAHLLLQTRTRVLNDDLEGTFRNWYPHFRPQKEKVIDCAPASHAS